MQLELAIDEAKLLRRDERQLPSLFSNLDDRSEAAIDHPLALEGHRILLRVEAVVGPHQITHSGHGGVTRRLIGPLDPGENDRLVGIRLNGLAKVGELPVGHVVAPTFKNALRAELFE
jgi:hypothetical protein